MTKNEIREVLTKLGAHLPDETATVAEHEAALVTAYGDVESDRKVLDDYESGDKRFPGDDPNPATQAPEATATGEAPFYCPGCGRRWRFLTECTGMTAAAPHAPIEVVSTDELAEGSDPALHTPAPPSRGF